VSWCISSWSNIIKLNGSLPGAYGLYYKSLTTEMTVAFTIKLKPQLKLALYRIINYNCKLRSKLRWNLQLWNNYSICHRTFQAKHLSLIHKYVTIKSPPRLLGLFISSWDKNLMVATPGCSSWRVHLHPLSGLGCLSWRNLWGLTCRHWACSSWRYPVSWTGDKVDNIFTSLLTLWPNLMGHWLLANS
jgi:hypothetical protein